MKMDVCALNANSLSAKHCKPCEGGVPAIPRTEIENALKQLDGWALDNNKDEVFRDFKFKNYYETMAFVNAIAWMAHHEDHHPDLEVGYNHVMVRYSTHAIGGLSENDLICAAKVNQISNL